MAESDTLHIGIPFEIVEETTVKAAGGQRFDVVVVKGVVTRPVLDAVDQVVDPSWVNKALTEWFNTGANVRQMHQARAVGRGIALERKGDDHVLTAKIADPIAVHLVREGVLHDYSIGVRKAHVTWGKSIPGIEYPPAGGVLDGGKIFEVTIADRGICPGTNFDIVKAAVDGSPEWTDILLFGFTPCDCGNCELTKAELTGSSRSNLPDSAFAYVEPGHKDSSGKTPDKFRHFPVHDECLTGDVPIPLLDGRTVPIAQLVDEDEFWVYAFDASRGAIVPGRGHDARMTTVAEVLAHVYLDNGELVSCTPDHRFLLRSGEYRMAQDLAPGDSIMPLYRTQRLIHDKPYEFVRQPFYRYWEPTHHMVDRGAHGALLDGHVVHHRNQDRFDNRPENLEQMDRAAHVAWHGEESGWAHVAKLHEGSRRRWLRPGAREKQAALRRAFNLQMVAEGRLPTKPMRDWCATAENAAAIHARYLAGESVAALARELGVSESGIKLGFKRYGLPSKRDLKLHAAENHKVTRIAYEEGEFPVYDISVDEYHNFGLESGIFVHNSHIRNALARAEGGQSPFAGKARKKIMAAARKHGIGEHDGDDSNKADTDSDDDSGSKCSTCKGSGKIRGGGVTCPDCKGKGAVVKGDIPDVDQQVTTALHAAEEAQNRDNEAHEEHGTGERTEKTFGSPPYWVERLHAHVCPAFDPDDVAGTYPAAKSFAEVVQPEAFHAALAKALTEDGGSGAFAGQISECSALYTDALTLKALFDEAPEAVHDGIALVRKMFTDEHPSIHISPTALSTTSPPGHGYISDGRQPQHRSGSPKIPSMNKVPSPSSVPGHGYISAGRQRSPHAGPPNAPGPGPTGFSGSGGPRDQAAETALDMHDRLAGRYPQMCPVGSLPGSRGMQADAKPTPVTPRLTKAQVEDMDAEELTALVKAEVDAAVKASVTKSEKADKKADKKVRKAEKALRTENEALKAQLEEAAKLPAALAQAVRVPGAPIGAPFAPAALEGAAVVEKSEGAAQAGADLSAMTPDIQRLVEEYQTGDNEQREYAYKALVEGLDEDQFVEVLSLAAHNRPVAVS